MEKPKKLFPYIEHFLAQGKILKMDQKSGSDKICIFMDTKDHLSITGVFPVVLVDFESMLCEHYHNEKWAKHINGAFWREIRRVFFLFPIRNSKARVHNFLSRGDNHLIWIHRSDDSYSMNFEQPSGSMTKQNRHYPLIPGNIKTEFDFKPSLESILQELALVAGGY